MSNIEDLMQRIVTVETKSDVRMDRMEKDIGEIKENVRQLTALANKGRGSLSMFLWMGGLVAGFVGLVGTVTGFHFGNNQ